MLFSLLPSLILTITQCIKNKSRIMSNLSSIWVLIKYLLHTNMLFYIIFCTSLANSITWVFPVGLLLILDSVSYMPYSWCQANFEHCLYRYRGRTMRAGQSGNSQHHPLPLSLFLLVDDGHSQPQYKLTRPVCLLPISPPTEGCWLLMLLTTARCLLLLTPISCSIMAA